MENKRWGGEADGATITVAPADGDDVVIRVGGELDAHAAPLLSEAAGYALSAAPGTLHVDLARCTFIDSSGLGALVKTHRMCNEGGRSFLLGPVSDQVERLLAVSGVGPLLASDG